MKRFLPVLLSACLVLGLLSGCGGNSAGAAPADGGRLRVVTTIFPIYDWVREIAGDSVELTMLLGSGVDLHSYQPTVDDIVKVSGCDVFIYVGGESDAWVQDAMKEASNPDMVVINLLEVLGDRARQEELVEGMEAEAGEEDAGEPELDEHIWLSLRNAAFLCGYIAERLEEKAPADAQTFRQNAEAYIGKLEELDGRYQAAVDAAPVRTLLFGDRFPFRYLTEDYGLNYYAAFSGCSAETEASFETIVFLAKKTDELGLHSILQLESSDGSIAGTIRDNTASGDQTILTLNSLQSTTAADAAAGASYLSIMEDNLKVLEEALS